jgi:hypothetical protein
MKKSILTVALLLSMLSACGRDGIGEEAAGDLRPQVAAVREAVAAGDRQTAAQGLVLVQATAVQLKEDGKLDDAAFQRIIETVNGVADLLSTVPVLAPSQAPLQVPVDQLNGTVQQAPAGAQGGRDGDRGAKGKDGERGKKGDKGD